MDRAPRKAFSCELEMGIEIPVPSEMNRKGGELAEKRMSEMAGEGRRCEVPICRAVRGLLSFVSDAGREADAPSFFRRSLRLGSFNGMGITLDEGVQLADTGIFAAEFEERVALLELGCRSLIAAGELFEHLVVVGRRGFKVS